MRRRPSLPPRTPDQPTSQPSDLPVSPFGIWYRGRHFEVFPRTREQLRKVLLYVVAPELGRA